MATATKKIEGSKRANMGRNTSAQDLTTFSGRLGANIRARREKLGLTVDEVAEELQRHGFKVSYKALYAWEAGQNPININALPTIAAKLGTTVRKLTPDE